MPEDVLPRESHGIAGCDKMQRQGVWDCERGGLLIFRSAGLDGAGSGSAPSI